MSTTENPPDRVIADRKNAWKTVSPRFIAAERRGIVELEREEGGRADDEQEHRRDERELGVQRPASHVPAVLPERVDHGKADATRGTRPPS